MRVERLSESVKVIAVRSWMFRADRRVRLRILVADILMEKKKDIGVESR